MAPRLLGDRHSPAGDGRGVEEAIQVRAARDDDVPGCAWRRPLHWPITVVLVALPELSPVSGVQREDLLGGLILARPLAHERRMLRPWLQAIHSQHYRDLLLARVNVAFPLAFMLGPTPWVNWTLLDLWLASVALN